MADFFFECSGIQITQGNLLRSSKVELRRTVQNRTCQRKCCCAVITSLSTLCAVRGAAFLPRQRLHFALSRASECAFHVPSLSPVLELDSRVSTTNAIRTKPQRMQQKWFLTVHFLDTQLLHHSDRSDSPYGAYGAVPYKRNHFNASKLSVSW